MNKHTNGRLPLYFGYESLEVWAEAADPDRPIYACALTDPGVTTKLGTRTDKQIIMVAQPDADGDVHYWRYVAGYVQMVNGEPFNTDVEERQQRHDQAWQIVHEWLEEQGFSLRRAAVVTPTDHQLFEGSATFLRYDSDTKQFYRREST